MVSQLTVSKVLEKAIQKEIESQQLYRDLSKKMTDEAAKDAFWELTRQEHRHQTLLEKYLRGELKEGALSRQQPIDYTEC
jgi:rubrerythrin